MCGGLRGVYEVFSKLKFKISSLVIISKPIN
jgi:hypothetical protein